MSAGFERKSKYARESDGITGAGNHAKISKLTPL